jgi:hypothetical protein
MAQSEAGDPLVVSETMPIPAAPGRAGWNPVGWSRRDRLLVAVSLALLAVSFMLAAGLRGHSPKVVIAALEERGVSVVPASARHGGGLPAGHES